MIREATSTDTFTAHFPRIDSYDFLLVRSLSVSNADNSGIRLEVGIAYNNVTLWVQSIVCTNNAYFYRMSGTLVVPRGYKVAIRVNSPNDGDTFYANVTGELVSYGD